MCPVMIVEVGVLTGFGFRIVWVLKTSIVGTSESTAAAYRKITFLLISTICGFIVIVASVFISMNKNLTIPQVTNIGSLPFHSLP